MGRETEAGGRTYGRIRWAGRFYRYEEDGWVARRDVWFDIGHLQQRHPERVGYPTQKPEALLTRVIAACSAPGQVVADFCCGSGTTLVVAERLGRRWLGVDVAPAAIAASA